MESYRTEEEQVEVLRRWWQENGRSVIAGVVLAVALSGGWQYWQSYSKSQAEGAAALYQGLLEDVTGEQISSTQRAAAVERTEALKANHASSTYAQFAALHMARLAVQSDDLAQAEAELRWILTSSSPGADVKAVTQLRLARVLASSERADEGLAMLETGADNAYAASYAVARGDILMQLGRDDEAREAYQQARLLVAGLDSPVPLQTLEEKLEGLNPVPGEPVTTESATEE